MYNKHSPITILVKALEFLLQVLSKLNKYKKDQHSRAKDGFTIIQFSKETKMTTKMSNYE